MRNYFYGAANNGHMYHGGGIDLWQYDKNFIFVEGDEVQIEWLKE